MPPPPHKVIATVRLVAKGPNLLRFALRAAWAWVRYGSAVLTFPSIELEIISMEMDEVK